MNRPSSPRIVSGRPSSPRPRSPGRAGSPKLGKNNLSGTRNNNTRIGTRKDPVIRLPNVAGRQNTNSTGGTTIWWGV